MKIQQQNTGLIIEKRTTDYVFGGQTKVVHEDRNLIGNWESFLPSDEHQKGRFFDTFGCVTFSAMNSLECQLSWMIENKLLTQGTLDFLNEFGYIQDGKLNFSDRFTVVMSGTTPGRGNSFQNVWDSIRKHGVAPEVMWPNNLHEFDQQEYYQKPLDTVKQVALKFLDHFKAEYESVPQSLIPKALKHCPIHIGTATCDGWFDGGIVNACDYTPNHATMLFKKDIKGYHDMDHYDPTKKVLAHNYPIPHAFKGILTPIQSLQGIKNVPNRSFLSKLLRLLRRGLKI